MKSQKNKSKYENRTTLKQALVVLKGSTFNAIQCRIMLKNITNIIAISQAYLRGSCHDLVSSFVGLIDVRARLKS